MDRWILKQVQDDDPGEGRRSGKRGEVGQKEAPQQTLQYRFFNDLGGLAAAAGEPDGDQSQFVQQAQGQS